MSDIIDIDEDILNFVKYVKSVVNTNDSMYFRDEIISSDLYKKLKEKYSNVDELMEQTIRKSDIVFETEAIIERLWLDRIMDKFWDLNRNGIKFAIFVLTNEFQRLYKSRYERFIWKYDYGLLEEIILKTIKRLPPDQKIISSLEKNKIKIERKKYLENHPLKYPNFRLPMPEKESQNDDSTNKVDRLPQREESVNKRKVSIFEFK